MSSAYLEKAFCQSCGSDWFRPTAAEDPEPTNCLGAIRVSGAGVVLDYNGVLVCARCGVPAQMPMRSPIPAGIQDENDVISVISEGPVPSEPGCETESPVGPVAPSELDG